MPKHPIKKCPFHGLLVGLTSFLLISHSFLLRAQNNTLSDSLQGYYLFQNNAADSSGYDHHARATGGYFTEDRFGNPLSAYQLTGDGSYVEIPAMINLLDPEWSFSLWFRLDQLPSERSDAFLLSYKKVRFGDDVHLFVDDEDDQIKTFFTNEFDKVSTRITVQRSQWYHAAIIYRPNDLVELYVNGQSRLRYPINFTSPSDSNLIIGSIVDVSPLKGRIEGAVDDVCVFNRALTSREIYRMFLSESKEEPWEPPVPPELLYYRVFPTVCRCDAWTIQTNDALRDIQIISVDGKLVATGERVAEEEYTINTQNLASGTYVVIAKSGIQTYRDKVVLVK